MSDFPQQSKVFLAKYAAVSREPHNQKFANFCRRQIGLKCIGGNFVRIFGRRRASEKLVTFWRVKLAATNALTFTFCERVKSRRNRGCGRKTGLERCAGVARVGKRSAAGERQLGTAGGLTYNFRCNFYSCGSVCE